MPAKCYNEGHCDSELFLLLSAIINYCDKSGLISNRGIGTTGRQDNGTTGQWDNGTMGQRDNGTTG